MTATRSDGRLYDAAKRHAQAHPIPIIDSREVALLQIREGIGKLLAAAASLDSPESMAGRLIRNRLRRAASLASEAEERLSASLGLPTPQPEPFPAPRFINACEPCHENPLSGVFVRVVDSHYAGLVEVRGCRRHIDLLRSSLHRKISK